MAAADEGSELRTAVMTGKAQREHIAAALIIVTTPKCHLVELRLHVCFRQRNRQNRSSEISSRTAWHMEPSKDGRLTSDGGCSEALEISGIPPAGCKAVPNAVADDHARA